MLSFAEGETQELKVAMGGRWVKLQINKSGSRLFCNFPFNRELMAEIKAMEGAKWHGYDDTNPRKMWSVLHSDRNKFQLAFLAGMNPYARFDEDHKEFPAKPRRKLYDHQLDMFKFGLCRHYGIIAGEMGVGKSLSAIEIMEGSGHTGWWWVAPKAGINSVRLELDKWSSLVRPDLMTYDELKKILANWIPGEPPPQGIFFDECQKLKTPTSQRTQAAQYLANEVRKYWGDNGYVILMSGTPAPKSPADWWSLCEVAYPGFIKEGTHQKFTQRLAIQLSEDSIAGGKYSRIVGWKDSERRCNTCGKMDDEHSLETHAFAHGINEVAKLYDRMRGLVVVKFKKDCLDLPDKIYRQIKLRPTIATANAARMISISSPSAVDKLIRLRELSDGFQYEEKLDGTEICRTCHGEKYAGTEGLDACPMCSGSGQQNKVVRAIKEIETPKQQAFMDLLEEYDDVGRLVCYAAFTASIDRCVSLALQSGWNVIRVDGRGWKMFVHALPGQAIGGVPLTNPQDMLKEFQASQDGREAKFDNLIVIGHPGSAGVGLTLTASPAIIYYSNDFSAENRIQSEDRIHRAGMDAARGATIIDLIHLPSDKLIVDNLQKKRDLQNITMGELSEALAQRDY